MLGGPHELAGLLADRHHVRVAQTGKQQPVADADTPLAAERRLGCEGPERRARRRIERHDDAGRGDDEHASVLDHRGGLGPVGGLDNPGAAQLLDVPRINPVESRVAGTRPVAAGRIPFFSRIRLSFARRPHREYRGEDHGAHGQRHISPTTASHQTSQPRHLLKPPSVRMKQVLGFRICLSAAAKRPPSEDSLRIDSRLSGRFGAKLHCMTAIYHACQGITGTPVIPLERLYATAAARETDLRSRVRRPRTSRLISRPEPGDRFCWFVNAINATTTHKKNRNDEDAPRVSRAVTITAA